MLDNEYWYGGPVQYGLSQPLSRKSEILHLLKVNRTANQVMPLFLSSKGRLIFGKEDFDISFRQGIIEVSDPVELKEGFINLKGEKFTEPFKYSRL
jgi:hypothetical protein